MKKEDFGSNFERWDRLFQSYCTSFPWQIAKSISMIESTLGLNPRVAVGLLNPLNVPGSTSTDGLSWGLMQLTIATASDYDSAVTPVLLNNPEYSVNIGSQLLARLYTHFDGQEEWVAKAYNEGIGNAYKERAGKIQGFAQEYWEKYQTCKAIL